MLNPSCSKLNKGQFTYSSVLNLRKTQYAVLNYIFRITFLFSENKMYRFMPMPRVSLVCDVVSEKKHVLPSLSRLS
jgi:hypothetical protein